MQVPGRKEELSVTLQIIGASANMQKAHNPEKAGNSGNLVT